MRVERKPYVDRRYGMPEFKEKLTDCYLYGSYARGDYHKYSDVDIMMVVDLDYLGIGQHDDEIANVGS